MTNRTARPIAHPSRRRERRRWRRGDGNASHEAIRSAHEYIGFAQGAGAFAGARNEIDRESFTDANIVVEGRMCAVHLREFMGFAPSGRKVELPFVAFYEFDTTGKLAHERVVMNLGPLRATD